jgi:hypothetical protein
MPFSIPSGAEAGNLFATVTCSFKILTRKPSLVRVFREKMGFLALATGEC